MLWLEELQVAKSLELPEVEIAQGGLAGINDALDQLRGGKVSGKRIVVPVGQENTSSTASNGTGLPAPAADDEDDEEDPRMAYANQLNSAPDRLKFAYWVPNVSGGLVISKIPQNTKWDYKANKRYVMLCASFLFRNSGSPRHTLIGTSRVTEPTARLNLCSVWALAFA